MNTELNNTFPVLYHGTNREGICGIIKSRYVGTEYFGEYGVYLTDDIENALDHGQYVLAFDNPDFVLETDDTNDGYFFRGKIDIDLISRVFLYPNDRRVIKDILQGSHHWH